MAVRLNRLRRPAGTRVLPLALVAIAWLALTSITLMAPAAAAPVDDEERLALALINRERSARGLPVLAFSASLQAAAEWMSLDQAREAIVRHDDSLGRGLRARLTDVGYPPNASIWENLAAGVRLDAARVVSLWMGSPPHRANILAPSARAVGLARAQIDEGRWYWTLDLGSSLSDDDRLTIPSAATAPRSRVQTWALIGWSAPDQDVATAATAYGWTAAVFSWDPVAAAFDTYFRALPASLNSLRTLRTGQAYWVALDPFASVPLLPAGPAVPTIQLTPGLNLVAWLGSTGVSLAEAAQSILARVWSPPGRGTSRRSAIWSTARSCRRGWPPHRSRRAVDSGSASTARSLGGKRRDRLALCPELRRSVRSGTTGQP